MTKTKKDIVEEFISERLIRVRTYVLADMIRNNIGNIKNITPYGPDDDEDDRPYAYVYDLPMWGTMWSFRDPLDEKWVRNHLEAVKDCGFTIYDSDEGIYLGIDGAGYDFFEHHWIPLCEKMGYIEGDRCEPVTTEIDRIKTAYLACMDLLQNDPSHGEEYDDDNVNELYAEAANYVNAVHNLGYDW